MRLRFEVKIKGRLVEVDEGVILPNGRSLRYRLGGATGIAGIGEWFLTEATKSSPWFRAMCWNALSAEEKVLASARRPELLSRCA